MPIPSFLTRRRFLESSAALLGFGLVGCRSDAETPATAQSAATQVLVPAHPWIYAATQPGYEIYPILDQIFADMAYAGLDGIELMESALRPEGAVERIRALSEQHDLPVIGTSYGAAMWDREQHAAILDDIRLVVPNLAAVGGRTLGTSVGSAGGVKTETQLDAQAELLTQIIAVCEDHGVVLNLHNHTYEVENDLHDLRGSLARLPEDVKLGPDLNWLVRGGVDPVEFIDTYGDRIVFLHLRDQYADGRWTEHLGQGSMDFTAIAAALQRANFSGDACIELAHENDFTPTQPIRESLRTSRAFVRDTLGY